MSRRDIKVDRAQERKKRLSNLDIGEQLDAIWEILINAGLAEGQVAEKVKKIQKDLPKQASSGQGSGRGPSRPAGQNPSSDG